ncbi:MAG: hypothetical protein P8R54_31435 [Myxococcota bacterium]|nr:hypothetical protein [Myxococcota bacterium]
MSRLAWAASGILGLGLMAVALDNRRLRSVLADMRQARAAASAAPAVATLGPHGAAPSANPAPPAAALPPPAAPATPDAPDLEEAVAARLAQQQAARMQQMQGNAADAVDDFADTVELADAVRDDLHGVVDDAIADLTEAWKHHGNDLSGEAMQAEVTEIRADLDDDLVALIGEEGTDAFLSTLGPTSWLR